MDFESISFSFHLWWPSWLFNWFISPIPSNSWVAYWLLRFVQLIFFRVWWKIKYEIWPQQIPTLVHVNMHSFSFIFETSWKTRVALAYILCYVVWILHLKLLKILVYCFSFVIILRVQFNKNKKFKHSTFKIKKNSNESNLTIRGTYEKKLFERMIRKMFR